MGNKTVMKCSKLSKLPLDYFSFSRWKLGNPLELFGVRLCCKGLPKKQMASYAIGYCDAGALRIRPKLGQKAVMFFKDGEFSWFHLWAEEFDEIFGDR